MSLLKAAFANKPGQPKRLIQGMPPSVLETAQEPGRWVSESELQALHERGVEQGRKEALAQSQAQLEASARDEAQRHAREQLARDLKSHQEAQAKAQSEKWRGLATALAEQAQGVRDQLHAELTEWTFLAVCRLMGQMSREHVAAAVRQVLEEARLNEPLTILLNARDLAAIDALGDEWPKQVRFAADERVSLGGCMLQSEHQLLDARLEVQLELLRAALDIARHEREVS